MTTNVPENQLYQFFFEPITEQQNQRVRLGLALTLLLVSICSLITYQGILRGQYQGEIFNDDVKVYFWFERFLDSELFPNDLIADYFKSVTPVGYNFLFSILTNLGVEPLFLMQIIPLFLIFFSSAYIFLLSLEIVPIITFGFLTTILSWMTFFPSDSLPRSFFLALFPAFLYYLIRGALLPCLGTIFLQGLLYTPFLFILIGLLIIRLFKWKNGRLTVSSNRQDYVFCLAGILVAGIGIIVYVLSSYRYLPSISGSEAIKMPEFWYHDGRAPYYSDNILDTYIFGWQSGLKPGRLLDSQTNIGRLSFLLPILLYLSSKFLLVTKIKKNIVILFQIIVVSLGLNLLAHLVFFKLYYPNRYTNLPLRFVIILASSLSLLILFEAVWRWLGHFELFSVINKKMVAITMTTLLGGYSLLYPLYLSTQKLPKVFYHVPSIEMFFTKQPKNIMVASLEEVIASNIPTFSKRSVLTASEFANPYHLKYYTPIKQRTIDLINAHYTDDLSQLKTFIEQYKVDFLVVREATFSPEFLTKSIWFRQWKDIAKKIKTQQEQEKVPSLLQLSETCAEFQSEDWLVVSSKCILAQKEIQ
ncbi:MAG TPA: hypothetical protein DCF68_05195 [Cyanothece sp. UBA12306]|nr:hypothetical protein [Cyanothece sp. UBA12306]